MFLRAVYTSMVQLVDGDAGRDTTMICLKKIWSDVSVSISTTTTDPFIIDDLVSYTLGTAAAELGLD